MSKFPVRKCYHAAKAAILLIFVVVVLAMFEKWRGGKRTASAFSDPIEAEYERQILEDEAKIIPGLGEGGVAAYLTGEDKRLGEESEKKLAMNVYLSDRISYNRTLKDHRNPSCARVVYDAELPSVSVILIFHNEPYSVVIRTIWSVINSCRRDQPWYKHANFIDRETGRTMNLGYPGQDPSSPLVYLKEIILVDDNSTLPELKGKLSHYVRTRLPPDLIRILHLPDRVGLTRARLAGARYATGAVLSFLDAHCEAQRDWLRPLLARVQAAPHAVVVPVIDVVDAATFYYSVQDPATFQVGGFTFTGHFTWIDVPEREKKRRDSDISPTWSPTMAGGLFAINRDYYWELGAYDEQMAGWGGENLEMSFRIWQCGGSLETVPCSRVGHVFRSFHPYGLPAAADTHGVNTARMAAVWMDDYAELFYLHRPDLRNSPKIGDVTHRKVLREKLQCKSFQWYLDNIYPEKFVPVRDAYGFGRFVNLAGGLCLDSLQREAEGAALGVYSCHPQLQPTQHFSLSLAHELRTEDSCAHAAPHRWSSSERDPGMKVLMSTCHGKQRDQKWTYVPGKQQLRHSESGLCLDAGHSSGADVLLRRCSDQPAQRWTIDYSEENDFRLSNDGEPSDQEQRLQRLRGQKRKSRSLLAYHAESTPAAGAAGGTGDTGGGGEAGGAGEAGRRRTRKKHKRAKGKAKKTKNKFILRLERAGHNASAEHLEVDIHCRHTRLFPNNSFVRDLVTILNEHDIRVINNGRVFERNKVVQLDKKRVLNKLELPQTPRPLESTVVTPQPVRKNKDPVPVVGAAGGTAAPPGGTEPRAHRIIIEDFVELTPASTHRPKRVKKRKRRRSTAPPAVAPAAPAAPAPSPSDDDALVSMLAEKFPSQQELPLSAIRSGAGVGSGEGAGRSSLEDTPPEGGGERDSGYSSENWPVGESRFRRNNSAAAWRRQRRPDAGVDGDTPDEVEGVGPGAGEGEAPVRVVMRSNLTFDLGDEFFQWRPDDTDAAAVAADGDQNELSIPMSRAAPPVHLSVLARRPPAAPTGDDDSSSLETSSD